MYQVPLVTSSSVVSREDFWKSVLIYHNRPHLINRQIGIADQVLLFKINCNQDEDINVRDFVSCHALCYEVRQLEDLARENITEDLLTNLFTHCNTVNFIESSVQDLKEENKGVFVSIRIIHPRLKSQNKCIELVIVDKTKNFLTFFPASYDTKHHIPLPIFAYQIELDQEHKLRIVVNNFEDADTSSAEWMADMLFSKLIKWTEIENKDQVESLSNVSHEQYYKLYNYLKNKYGDELVKDWKIRTGTDPQKYIFEDVGIAAYLISFWSELYGEKYREFVKFVDCGCGNGLLVYILCREGIGGYGIDVKRRLIWDLFKDHADLRVGAVLPHSTFPEATWLIGNHSDELTPWLPVIALKSSINTNYFVLPCCLYDFDGDKYVRRNSAVSQYADYLLYIEKISELSGFETSIDKLRIPSTKRTCLIGVQKSVDVEKTLENITDYINLRSNGVFIPRPSIERVRNCTQIDRKLLNEIVTTIVAHLLDDIDYVKTPDGSQWNRGGHVKITTISNLLPQWQLNILKKECGGLQTLLRNHRYLFRVDQGMVRLEIPYRLEHVTKYKEKPCWFEKFHPDGCYHDSKTCCYKHDGE